MKQIDLCIRTWELQLETGNGQKSLPQNTSFKQAKLVLSGYSDCPLKSERSRAVPPQQLCLCYTWASRSNKDSGFPPCCSARLQKHKRGSSLLRIKTGRDTKQTITKLMNKEQRFSEKQALGIKTQGSLGVFKRNATSFTLKDHRFPFLQRPKLPLDSEQVFCKGQTTKAHINMNAII